MNKIDKIIKAEGNQRSDAIRKLMSYLINPGRFSILVLGLRGTGKSHWIKEIQKNVDNIDCFTKTKTINSALTENFKIEQWERLFEEIDNGVLVIDDVEKLTVNSQNRLFEGISTDSHGNFGFNEKKYKIRIVFTSTYDIKSLRDTEEYLQHKFFDRISQFVVKFPSYKDANSTVWRDFTKSWNKMNFEDKNQLPGNELQTWLEKHSHEFHGHFRDLDKIAVNWHNYRLQGIEETEILSKVRIDFSELYHYPEHRTELSDTFHIDKSLKYDDNLKKFKKFYKEWAKIEFGSLKKAEKTVDVCSRTMERW